MFETVKNQRLTQRNKQLSALLVESLRQKKQMKENKTQMIRQKIQQIIKQEEQQIIKREEQQIEVPTVTPLVKLASMTVTKREPTKPSEEMNEMFKKYNQIQTEKKHAKEMCDKFSNGIVVNKKMPEPSDMMKKMLASL